VKERSPNLERVRGMLSRRRDDDLRPAGRAVLDTGTQQFVVYSGARWSRALNTIRHRLKGSAEVFDNTSKFIVECVSERIVTLGQCLLQLWQLPGGLLFRTTLYRAYATDIVGDKSYILTIKYRLTEEKEERSCCCNDVCYNKFKCFCKKNPYRLLYRDFRL